MNHHARRRVPRGPGRPRDGRPGPRRWPGRGRRQGRTRGHLWQRCESVPLRVAPLAAAVHHGARVLWNDRRLRPRRARLVGRRRRRRAADALVRDVFPLPRWPPQPLRGVRAARPHRLGHGWRVRRVRPRPRVPATRATGRAACGHRLSRGTNRGERARRSPGRARTAGGGRGGGPGQHRVAGGARRPRPRRPRGHRHRQVPATASPGPCLWRGPGVRAGRPGPRGQGSRGHARDSARRS